MPIKQASPKAKAENVFGHARKPAKMFRAGLYARVSTNDQQALPIQGRAMREYAARRGWTITVQVREVGSGAARREAREKILEAARRREIDLVLVWRLDRWGRSVTDLLATLQELEHLDVGFASLTEALDLTTPTGRAMAGLLAIFAEFEREILRERTRTGLAQARLNGKRLGRPETAARQAAEIRKLHRAGVSKSEIARRLEIGRTSVRRILEGLFLRETALCPMIGERVVLPMVLEVRYWLTTFEISGHQQPLYGMELGNDRLYFSNGCIYVPLYSAPLAAGVFLSTSANSIDQHLELPPEHEFRHGVRDRYVDGKRTHRPRLFAARIRGNSMVDRDVLDGDFVIIQHSDFAYPEYGKIVVVERLGEEEGMGAWTLKHLVLDQPSSSDRNEFGDELEFENPSILLRCHNPQFRSWLLDPSGQYWVRGVLLRSLRPENVHLVDSDMLRRVGIDEE